MLTITCAPIYKAEREYTCHVMFKEFLGLKYTLEYRDHRNWRITTCDDKELILPDIFFQASREKWLSIDSLPAQPLPRLDVRSLGINCSLLDSKIPVIYGDSTFSSNFGDLQNSKGITTLYLPVDILGSAFFMLSRYEEVVKKERDEHERFPAWASLAFQQEFLDRPIVNEYLEILWTALKKLWPGLKRNRREGKIRVTCDVDEPYDRAAGSLVVLCKLSGGDLLKRKNLSLLTKRWQNFFYSRRGNYLHDPYYIFDWYMDTCEKYDRKVAFYFISDHTAGKIDGYYKIEEPLIKRLLQKINIRGHEIGVHGSYNSFFSEKQIKKERLQLLEACFKAGVETSVCGNRQHFLRWDVSQTPDYLDNAGFDYDTTGAFADLPGFRYGTATPFSIWSWMQRKKLSLMERPLILMECSVIADRYMGLGYSKEALDVMTRLKERSLMFGGDFTLLWHNSHLITEEDKMFFKEIIS